MSEPGGQVDGLSQKQEAAVLALLSEPSVARAAQAAGVAERTLYRWLDEPAFAAAHRRARRQAFAQAINLTQRYGAMAVQALVKVMADQNAPHSSRVSAATALLRFSREAIELDDLSARIEALERAQDPQSTPVEHAA